MTKFFIMKIVFTTKEYSNAKTMKSKKNYFETRKEKTPTTLA